MSAEKRPWARPHCITCKGFGFVIMHDKGSFAEADCGNCTEAAAPTITENETVADFVPCERTVRHVAAMVEDWANNALSSETSRMIAAVAKDILINALPKKDRAEELAIKFHEIYETKAPSFGYETRPDTKQFDPTTANGRLMIEVCRELIAQGEIRR